ncbi:type II secretion system F family protein [Candidatus Saccharibacteria bacterium]|nr:type II secretion system F family protein [Candidatus Saccharibacteria bacterium]MBI3337802.1 type II secretion system F family protein [Candidatus Saccharibacteria bacterium]
MLTYKYIAKDMTSGQKIKAQVQADSEQEAAKLIHAQGFTPLNITLEGAGVGSIFKRFGNHVKTKDKVLFSRQLSTLINAGLPIIQSLRSVLSQTQSKPLKAVINQVITDVEGGSALSVSLGRHPAVFNDVFTSLIAAGEVSGTLDAALDRLAIQQEKDAEVISKVRGAMIYPIIVVIVMMGVVGFMVVTVLPQVEILYDGLPGSKLPFVTVALLALSHFVIKFWWLVLVSLVVFVLFTTRWARTLAGKRVFDKLKMKSWPIGPLFMKLYMARFARTGTTLVSSGVPLIQMLEITSDAIDNVHIAESIKAAIEKVKGGKALSTALENDPNFLELVPNMLKIGEQSGSIEQMLAKTADYYEKEVDNQIKAISTIIEPVMMVLIGGMAFIIVAAVLLPIYGLAGQNIIK